MGATFGTWTAINLSFSTCEPTSLIKKPLYFDDIQKGQQFTLGPYHVEKKELLDFNKTWDPLPIHTDNLAAQEKGFKGITASGQYTMCIKQRLLNTANWTDAVIGALAFDELRFPTAVYPEDILTLHIECISTRRSKSKSDRGIVKFSFRLVNQEGSAVLTYLDTVLFSKQKKSKPEE